MISRACRNPVKDTTLQCVVVWLVSAAGFREMALSYLACWKGEICFRMGRGAY